MGLSSVTSKVFFLFFVLVKTTVRKFWNWNIIRISQIEQEHDWNLKQTQYIQNNLLTKINFWKCSSVSLNPIQPDSINEILFSTIFWLINNLKNICNTKSRLHSLYKCKSQVSNLESLFPKVQTFQLGLKVDLLLYLWRKILLNKELM